jgi:hypothetical protein
MKSIQDYLKKTKDINYNSWFIFSGLSNLEASSEWMKNIDEIKKEKLQKTRKQQG